MVEDARPRAGWTAAWAAAAVVAAGAVVGLAVEFHWLGWTSIPGGSCGSDLDPCPDGTMPTILLAFLCTFAGFAATAAALAAFARIRPGRTLPAVLVVVGMLLALWPGRQFYVWLRGPVLDPVWQADRDRPSTVRGLGVWTVGENAATVVRVRGDALVAYDSRDGDRRWSLTAPVRGSVCAMSASVVDGVGLVGFGRYGKPCDTVWGVDVRSGRKLWQREISGVPAFTTASDGLLTADRGVAVALADGAVHGYDLADGTLRWTANLRGTSDTRDGGADKADKKEGGGVDAGAECEPLVGSAAGGTTRVVVTCIAGDATTTSARLVTLDNATGREVGSRRLPVESPVDTAMVVSADPFTLLLKERDARGVAAVLAYSGTGDGDPVEIPLSGSEEDLAVAPMADAFAARPALSATVGDGRLVVAAARPGAAGPDRVVGYSLSDGKRLWHQDLGGTVTALAPAGRGQVAVLGGTDRLWRLDTGDGHRLETDDGTLVRDVDGKIEHTAQLLRADDTWLVVNSDGDSRPPVLGVRG
ncbi:outer membrane protein assembly factor BamB family protein [Streptomyces adustus]|uniref:outer membrane protein assembly factor BamB family protein n=1 Tax=Streptomyces adustus TaxID=1609272 RepID=UPI00371FCABF